MDGSAQVNEESADNHVEIRPREIIHGGIPTTADDVSGQNQSRGHGRPIWLDWLPFPRHGRRNNASEAEDHVSREGIDLPRSPDQRLNRRESKR